MNLNSARMENASLAASTVRKCLGGMLLSTYSALLITSSLSTSEGS